MAPSFGRHNLKNYLTQWYKKNERKEKKKRKQGKKISKKVKKNKKIAYYQYIYPRHIYIYIY